MKVLNHKFYFLLNKSCRSEEKGRKNQNSSVEESDKLSGNDVRTLSDFICVVDYLKYKADCTVFVVAVLFVACVKGFEGECCKK